MVNHFYVILEQNENNIHAKIIHYTLHETESMSINTHSESRLLLAIL